MQPTTGSRSVGGARATATGRFAAAAASLHRWKEVQDGRRQSRRRRIDDEHGAADHDSRRPDVVISSPTTSYSPAGNPCHSNVWTRWDSFPSNPMVVLR